MDMSVPGGSIVTMGRVHVSGYYRNGRWVSSYTQNRRSGIGEPAWAGRSPLAIAAGLALVAALAVGGVLLIRGLVHQLTYDPVRDPAPLAGSSRFQTAGVLCEGTAGQTPLVRCQLTGGVRLEPRAADPLCESPWHGTTVVLKAGGRPSWVCIDSPLQQVAGTTYLSVGQTASYGSIDTGILTCQAISNGAVNCQDSRTRFGFEFGPHGYQFRSDIFGSI